MRKRSLLALTFAALAIAARLPFLLSSKIAFDSDEAVEGLMARHVLHGEFPAFFWAQAYKGVPEVYAAAAAFAAFGSNVLVLKSVTLVFFAAYIALNFALIDRIAGRWAAAGASLLLILCPPALVFWSLDASAEFIVLMLTGTILLVLLIRAEGKEQRANHKSLLAAIGLIVGIGLWVQQIFAFYLIPAGIIVLLSSAWWRQRDTARLDMATRLIAVIAAIYFLLAVIVFFTGGISISVGGISLGARGPQKILRIAFGVAIVAVLVHLRDRAAAFLKRGWPFLAGFLVGYSPVLLYSVFIEPAHAPLRNANARQMLNATPDILGNVIPILSGFKMATTERLPIPIVATIPIALALAAYLWANRHRLVGFLRLRDATNALAGDFFPLFVVLVPMMFLFSGAYLDTQSYRYLIPYYAGLSVAVAAGCLWLGNFAAAQLKLRPTVIALRPTVIASGLLATILAVHGWQQVLWYRKLAPDIDSTRIIDCLKRKGIRGGYAGYWTSYKLTFLSNEEIIIAPTDGVDRYPAFTRFVESLPGQEKVELRPDTTSCN